MDTIIASAMYPHISHLLTETERREAEDVLFDMEARARGYVPERTCRIVNKHEGTASTHLRMLGHCSKCGEVIEVTHKFCFECGAKVVDK